MSKSITMNPTDSLKVKDLNFTLFIDIVNERFLEFENGREWNSDDWNDSYVSFKQHSFYKNSRLEDNLVNLLGMWVNDFYLGWNFDTHNARPVWKDGR